MSKLTCAVCGYEPKPYTDSQQGECLYTISWQLVDAAEYEARSHDGRTTWLQVCGACREKYTGKPPESIAEMLHGLNKKRERESATGD